MKTENKNALVVQGVGDLQIIGKQFAASGMFGCNSEGQGVMIAMTCVMENITPLEFQRTYHIIDGRVTMRADAMLAKFVERGGKYGIDERSNEKASARFVTSDNAIDAVYTIDDAKKSGICFGKSGKMKVNWAKFTKQMLWARLVSDSIRAIDPGVCAGSYTPEEVSDFDDGDRSIVMTGSKPVIQAEAVEEDDTDYNVMPAGKHKGEAWGNMQDDKLEAVLKCTNSAITEKHKDAVQDVLSDRANRANNKKEKDDGK